MKVYRDIVDNNGNVTKTPIFNIMEGTYSGKDMGERSITATIEFPTPIDFHAGDYVEFDIADLIRGENVEGGHFLEKFYIYTMPTIKKVASSMSVGNAFEHTVTFYPRQYELGCMQMRDVLQQVNSGIIYTGYDEFSFYGGAKTLIDRVIAVLNERFPKTATGVAGVDYWDYRISDSVNEERNTALEKFQFDFSGNSVMDAVLKLNDENGINTKFWINERMIYIGFKRPYVCGVDSANVLRTIPFDFKYGKTSHLPISTNYGNLFTITKSLGSNSPITRLYAYGADRNLHRFYCSDRIKSGRYVNHLMLPSFGNDGKTDYIDSSEGIAKFGIREGSKTFDEIYPSLRYFTYGDIRSVKYCIKIMGSGVEPDSSQYERGKTYQYPIARVQCYKVEPLAGTKVNHLVQSAPPVDLAVFCHATGKTVKVILYAAKDGKTALQRQQEAAGKWDNGNYRVPAQTLHGTDYIAGSAFAIHDENYPCAHTHEKYTGSIGAKQQDDSGKPLTRDDWFVDADKIEIHEGEEKVVNPAKEKYQNEVSIHQIHYTDTHWITDIFEFTAYDQTSFQRQGYSAYCWARINNTYPESMSDSIEVNQVVDVPNVVIPDTDLNSTEGTNQQYWEIFTRDMGFKINEQTWFGDYVFLFGNCTVNFLDGNLGGYGFTCPKENNSKKVQEIYIPALLDDGVENEAFFRKDDYVSEAQCRKAYEQGAYWRILLQRADTDIANYWMPNISVNGNAGDHFVFLDIYMPDIYQRVAERRLEKEARKYLDANDDGDIQYSFDFDKVRMIQVPAFGLQMREGAIMRVVDDDLDVKTLNSAKTIFQQTSGLVSRKTVYQTTYTESSQEKVYYTEQHRDIDYLIEQGVVKLDEKTNKILKGDSAPITHKLYFSKDPTNLVNGIHIDAPAEWIYISDEDLSDTTGEPFAPINGVNVRIVERKTENSNFAYYLTDLYLTLNAKNIRHNNSGQYLVDLSYHSQFGVLPRWYEDRDGKFLLGIVEYDMHYPHTYDETIYTPNINLRPQGSRFFCPSQQLTEFKANKYYEVTMDCENTTMPFFDKNGMRTLFALLNNLGDYASWFVPEYISEEITDFDGSDKWRRFVFKFTLEETFNDSQDYYPAIQYISDGKTEEVSVRLISIIESDAGGLKELNYADLNIDTITIKFHDNTREHGVSLQNGIEPSRRVGNAINPMIREISATVKEESRASAWAQMMSRIEDNEILGDQVIRTQEQIANAARRRYRELLALRDSIFDPDGTCDQTFLHIMMLQVGADSMNYQLDKTHQSANGNALSNCRIDRVENNNDTFSVLSEDILRHYVFTEDEPQGLWYVEKPVQAFDLAQVADDNGTLYYPTYFVAIKCAIHDSRSAVWVCEPTQHKVNEDSEYYYFNWGILNPDDEGHYTLTETRGNAYMYGDNLVCGKISTLAGQSYFDLTHGNFVLSDGTTKALSYENGILTIGGINDESADSILIRLGLTEKVAEDAQSTADSAKAALDNLQIGGRNLAIFNTATVSSMRKGTDYDFAQTNADTKTQLYLSIDDFNGSNGSSFKSYVHNEVITEIGTYSYSFTLTADTSLLRIKHNGSKVDVISVFHFTEPLKAGTNLVLSLTFTNVTQGTFAWKNVKIEKGTVATDWTPAPEDVEASIAENKEYAEGLVTALGDNLQNQIDGVVDSFFMEGVPTTANAPANEWTTDDLKKRHEGDTYTDITKFVDDETTPYAGHSWRWCKGTSDSPATTWHWHEIADSDAVRALQNAAKAQDTADGKRRVFVVQPTPPYDLGDLWAQGNGEGKDMLKCKTAKTAGQTFAQDDWESASSALAAAQAAQDSVDNMEIGGENLYTGDNPLTIAVWNSRLVTYKLCTNLQNSGKYIFSCENSTDSSGLIGSTYIVGLLNQDDENDLRDNVNIPFGNDFAKQVFTIPNTGNWSLVIRMLVMRQTLTWTNIMVQKGTKATSYQTALAFLGKAIKDMDTTVTGGLLMTGVMMLKDTDNKTVTAGMSGLTEYIPDGETVAKKDNVLLWGGADYANAFVAANNADYAKKNGTPITTLIKKDGTGKIGIFKISDTQAVVDVPNQGQVVIDAGDTNGGIFIKDNRGLDKAVITPQNLDDISLNNTYIIQANESATDATFTNNSSWLCTKKIATFTDADKGTNIISGSGNFTIKLTFDPYYLQNNGNVDVLQISIMANFADNTSIIMETFVNDTIRYSDADAQNAINNRTTFIRTYSVTNINFARNVAARTINGISISAELIGSTTGNETTEPACSFDGSSKITYSVFAQSKIILTTNPHTIIAKDGILSYYDSSKFFKVQNTSTGQQIYAKGLGTTKGTSGSGELYVSKNFVDAFKALCDELNKFFQKVRTVGNNSTNADECVKKVTAVKNMLDATSIIANS